MAEAAIGSEIAGHRLEAIAGRGGMGVVYKATQLRLKRTVALKLISGDLASDPSFRQRFEHESEIAAQIEHPNVIPLYEAGEEHGQLYITMRYVEGTDLKALIQREGGIDPRRTATIMRQVCGALDAAHARGLVHRDIKPGNVLIAGTPQEPYAYLTDFGLTKQAASSGGMTKTGMFVGTLDYIAPEQLQGGPVDARADVYALGCMLYQMLTGRVPYERDTEPAKIWAHMQEPPPALSQVAPHVPTAFSEVVSRAMAKKPEDRYPSAGDLARAVDAAAEDRRIGETGERSVAAGAAAPGATAYSTPTYPGPGQTPPGGHQVVPQPATAGGGTYANAGGPPTYQGGVPTAYGSQPGAQGSWPAGTGGGTAPGYATAGPGGAVGTKSRTPLFVAGGVVAAVAIIAVVVLVLAGGGDGGGGGEPEGNPAGEVSGQPIKVGKEPQDLAFGGGAIWSANVADGTVTRIDPGTNATQSIKTGGFPVEVDFSDEGGLFVWTEPDKIVRVDPATNEVSDPIDLPADIGSVAVGDGFVWISQPSKDNVVRINEQTLAIEGDPIDVGDNPGSLAVGEGGVWVTNTGDKTITKIETSTADVFANPIPLDFDPGGIGVVEGTVYVGTGSGIVQIDPTSFTIEEPITLRGASFYDVGQNSLWATFPTRGQLQRIDLATRQPVGEPIDVGKGAQGVAVGIRGIPDVWVVHTKESTVTRVKAGAAEG